MSGRVTQIRRDKPFRRAIELQPARKNASGDIIAEAIVVVLWIRWSQANGQWETAAGRLRTPRRKLRWRRFNQVLWETFGLDVPPPPRIPERELAATGAGGGGR